MRLTRDEIILIATVLSALLVGGTVKHCRDQSRLRSGTSAAPVIQPPNPGPPEGEDPK